MSSSSSVDSTFSESDSTFLESESSVAFNKINTGVFEFNTKLQARKYIDKSIVPYFLYVITPNADGKLVSFSLGDESTIIDSTELDPSKPDKSITDVITAHISAKLQKLYAKSIPSDEGSTSSVDNTIFPELAATESTVDKIISYYRDNNDKLQNAVEVINTTYNIQLVSEKYEMSGISEDDSIINKFATNDDGNTIDTLTSLLKLEKNEQLLNTKPYTQPTSGGSRSRKHRRRHKQKKTKNTKRRNRK